MVRSRLQLKAFGTLLFKGSEVYEEAIIFV
jgi:hypothetical protein